MMIRCPDCGGTQVREERHIPLPARGLPFLRYVGKAWKVIMVVLGLLGTFAVPRFILWGMELMPEEGTAAEKDIGLRVPKTRQYVFDIILWLGDVELRNAQDRLWREST